MTAEPVPHLEVVEGGRQHATAYTDLGNAELFVRQHGDRFRWVAESRHWLVWDRGRWRHDITRAVERAAKQTAKGMLEAAGAIDNDDARGKAAKWAAASQSEARISSMLALARTEKPIIVTTRHLDAHPYLLSCANGTLDLTSCTLKAADPAELPHARHRRRLRKGRRMPEVRTVPPASVRRGHRAHRVRATARRLLPDRRHPRAPHRRPAR